MAMIVNIGRRIIVEITDFQFKRDADAPGLVKVFKSKTGQSLDLPGNKKDAEIFIDAYRRCIEENIEYRTTGVEDGKHDG
jgi:hypothetical protein